MINENNFDIAQVYGSSCELLWKQANLQTPMGMNAGIIEFDRGDYPLLLVVTARVHYTPGQTGADPYRLFSIIPNRVSPMLHVIGGNSQFAQNFPVSSGSPYEGFYRIATVVENGLEISACQWKYGTYRGSTNINNFATPVLIYGIR
jgi:hypothetical protein